MSSSTVPPLLPQDPVPGGPAPLSPELQAAAERMRAAGAQREQQRQQELLAGFNAAVQTNPDVAARAHDIAKQLGIPTDGPVMFDADRLKVAERLVQENELAKFYADHPMLDRTLRDVNAVRLLRDDLGNLKKTSDTFDWLWRSLETGAASNEAGYLKAKVGIGIPLSMAETTRLRELKDIEAMAGGETGVFNAAANLVGQIAMPMLQAVGTGLAVGALNPIAGAIAAGAVIVGQTGTTEFGHEYESLNSTLLDALLAQGVEPEVARTQAHETAMKYGIAYGAVAGLTEIAGDALFVAPALRASRLLAKRTLGKGIAQITKGAALRTLGAEMALSALGEAGEEALQEAESSIAENLASKSLGLDVGPTLSETVSRMGDVAWQVTQGMLLLAPLGPLAHYFASNRAVEKAKFTKSVFDRIAKNAEESKYRERSPEGYADAVSQMVKPPQDTVFIPGSKLAAGLEQAGITREEFAHDLPEIARQLEDSEKNHNGESDVKIPMGDFAARIAASELYQHIQQSIRLDENGYSADQAEEWLKERDAFLKATAEKIAHAQAKVEGWSTQLNDVEERMFNEVKGSPKLQGQDARFVAKLHRFFVEVNAAEAGISPQQFDEQHRLRFRFQAAEARDVLDMLDQARQQRRTDTPEFKEWFRDSAVTQPNGEPLRVFHGTLRNFTVFDPAKVNPESDFGQGLYFTSSPDDAAANYANLSGPDRQNMVEQLKERAEQHPHLWKGFDSPEAFARAWVAEHPGATMPVYLSIQTPFVLGGDSETQLSMDQAVDENGDPIDKPTGSLINFVEGLRRAAREHGADAEEDIARVLDEANYESITAADLIDTLKEHWSDLDEATDDSGRSVSREILRRALELAGFDGIIDHSVDVKFGSHRRIGRKMQGVTPDTTHFVAFHPEQVKSVNNNGAFSRLDPDILKQSHDQTPSRGHQRATLRTESLEVREHYGTPVDGASSVLGVHFSREARDSLDGNQYGSGAPGAERKRLIDAPEVLKQRIHFYVDTGQGVTPEPGVGREVHAVHLDNIYDVTKDPRGFVAAALAQRTSNPNDLSWMNSLEEAIVKAGFDGIYVPAAQGDQGVAVLLGNHTAVPVAKLGAMQNLGEALLRQDAAPVHFYSALQRGIESLQARALTADGWQQQIKGLVSKGIVRERELFWTMMPEWFADQDPTKKLTKEEVLLELSQRGASVSAVSLQFPDGERVLKRTEWVVVNEYGDSMGTFDSESEADEYAGELNDEFYQEWLTDNVHIRDVGVAEFVVTSDGQRLDEETFFDAEDEDGARDDARARADELNEQDAERLRAVGWTEAEVAARQLRFHVEKGAREQWVLTSDLFWVQDQMFDSLEEAVEARNELLPEVIRRVDVPFTIQDREVDSDTAEPRFERYTVRGPKDGYAEVAVVLDSVPERVVAESGHPPDEHSLFDARDHSFGDDSTDVNRLAHFRYTLRNVRDPLAAPGGLSPAFFLEETQSDYADTGREGLFYRTPAERTALRQEAEAALRAAQAEHNQALHDLEDEDTPENREAAIRTADALATASARINKTRKMVQAAPFVDTTDEWLTLTLKKAILWMVEKEGLDTLVLARGDQNAAIYGLDRVVRSVSWESIRPYETLVDPGADAARLANARARFTVENATTKLVTLVLANSGVQRFKVNRQGTIVGGDLHRLVGHTLAEAVGKEVATQILATWDHADANFSGKVEGEGLSVGGGGMRAFYGDEQGYKRTADDKVMFNAKGAPIPAVLPKALRELLKKVPGVEFTTVQINGLGGPGQFAVRFNADAIAKIREGFPLFQDSDALASYNPLTNEAFLGTEHNPTSFLHEMSHFWLVTKLKLASLPTSSVRMREDAQILMNWFGVKDIDEWNRMTLEQQRGHHETFAYNMELYLAQRQAPAATEERIGIFRAFARWFRRAYRATRDQLNPIYKSRYGKDLPALTKEVREVFDRMLASEDTIIAAEAQRQMMPMFGTRPDGVSDAEWNNYQQLVQDAHDDAVDRLTADSLRTVRWMRNVRKHLTKEVDKEAREARNRIETEERRTLEQEPVYRARRALARGESVEKDGSVVPIQFPKLNTGDARRLLSELNIEGNLLSLLPGMTSDTGATADFLASILGFESGAELIRALATAPSLNDAVEDRANARMLSEHAELSTPKKRQERAEQLIEEALHNPARSKMVAAELRFLSRVVAPPSVVLRAARAAAREIMDQMRVGEVSPHTHAQNEARARRESAQALRRGNVKVKGQPQEDASLRAARLKRQELLESQLAREARKVRTELEGAQKLVKLLFKQDEKLANTRDLKYVGAARALAAAFGLGPKGVNPVQFIEQLRAYDPALFEQLAPVFGRAQEWLTEAQSQGRDVRSWKDLTVDEFRDLADALAALWNQAKRVKEFGRGEEKVALDEAALALREQEAKNPAPKGVPLGAATPEEKRAKGLKKLFMLWTRVEHWTRRKDAGGQEGGIRAGAFTRYVWRPVRDAVDRFVTARNIYTKRVADMVRGLRPKLRTGTIEWRTESGELIYVFGRGNGGFGQAELIGALLHTGNEGNLRRLLLNREGWGEQDLETGKLDTSRWDAFRDEMVRQGYITKDVMDFVQAVWDLVAELKPGAQQSHYDQFGYYFREVEAQAQTLHFSSGDVTYAGGYMPAVVDHDASAAARLKELREIEQDYRQQYATTGRGFTRTRTGSSAPLSLDLDMVPAHIDDVLRFTHIQPAIQDVQRLLKREDVAAMLDTSQPGVWNSMLLPWLQRTASQSTTKAGMSPLLDRFFRGVRKNAGLSMMFANLANAMQQFTGVFLAGVRVKPRYLFSGMWQLLSQRGELLSGIAEASEFMDNRQHGQIIDSVETINSLNLNKGSLAKTQAWVSKHAYFLQMAFQNVMDAVVWQGAYEQSIAEQGPGVDDATAHREAVHEADAAVRMTQSSFDPTDVAGYEVGTPGYKLLTQFTGYFNTVANLHADEFRRIANSLGFAKAGRAFLLYVLGFVAPVLVADAIARTMRGGWDDDDKDGSVDVFTVDFLFLGQLKSLLAEVPIAGPMVVTPVLNWITDSQQWNDRMLSSPAIALTERAGAGAVHAVKTAIDPAKDLAGRDIRDVMTLFGFLFGLPAGAVGSRAGYLYDIGRGKVEPTSGLDFARGLLGGAASRASVKK